MAMQTSANFLTRRNDQMNCITDAQVIEEVYHIAKEWDRIDEPITTESGHFMARILNLVEAHIGDE